MSFVDSNPDSAAQQLCDLLSYLLPLSHSFLICKMGIVMMPVPFLKEAVWAALQSAFPRSSCHLPFWSMKRSFVLFDDSLLHCLDNPMMCLAHLLVVYFLSPCISEGGIYFFCQLWLLVWIEMEFRVTAFSVLELCKDFPFAFWHFQCCR